jgi:hypothetical protein
MTDPCSSKGPLPNVVTISQRPALGSNDFIEWGSLPESDGATLIFQDVPNDGKRYFGKTSTGRDYSITQPTELLRLTQGDNGSWFGNFAEGQAVLFTNGRVPASDAAYVPSGEPLVIQFSHAIRGAGVQFQGRLMDWSSSLAFSAHLVLVGGGRRIRRQRRRHVISRNDGHSSNANDGSAIYVGARTPGPPSIIGLELYVHASDGSPIDFAINRLDLLR